MSGKSSSEPGTSLEDALEHVMLLNGTREVAEIAWCTQAELTCLASFAEAT